APSRRRRSPPGRRPAARRHEPDRDRRAQLGRRAARRRRLDGAGHPRRRPRRARPTRRARALRRRPCLQGVCPCGRAGGARRRAGRRGARRAAARRQAGARPGARVAPARRRHAAARGPLTRAQQSETGLHSAVSSFPRATFVPVVAVVGHMAPMPTPERSDAPPSNPLPSAVLLLTRPAFPLTKMPKSAFPEADDDWILALLPTTRIPLEFPSAIDDFTDAESP